MGEKNVPPNTLGFGRYFFLLLYVFFCFSFLSFTTLIFLFSLAVKFFASHYTIHSFHSTQQTLVLRLCWLALA